MQIFIEEQHILRTLIDRSKLPVLHLDVSENDIQRLADTVADWLEQTGGLHSL
jgi:hypothetical protein